jgi:SRSO17 transposase
MSASRQARPTIQLVDESRQLYEGLFPEVRSFEAFKLLHLGMISEIKRVRFERVLADSLYGESGTNFIRVLHSLKLPYIVAIRSNHRVWMPQEQEGTAAPWRKFTRTFSNGETEVRYRQDLIYGTCRTIRYWLLQPPKPGPTTRRSLS